MQKTESLIEILHSLHLKIVLQLAQNDLNECENIETSMKVNDSIEITFKVECVIK